MTFLEKTTPRREIIDVAMGREPPDLLVKGGKLVNVHTGEICSEDVAVKGDRVAYVGDARELKVATKTQVLDAQGKYVTPGLVQTHNHLYHTQLNFTQVARVLMSHGTTVVAESFYALGIVVGVKGIRFCLEEIKRTPLKTIFLVPMLAYYQARDLGLRPTPDAPTFEDVVTMLDWPECHGIEEPSYTPITNKDPHFVSLFEKAVSEGKVIAGHASGISKHGLSAYLAMGADSDHECVTAQEALEKARVGMRVAMREGSAASDIAKVVKALTEYRVDPRYFTFSVDLMSGLKAAGKGGMDECIRIAISKGLNPVTAVQLATLNAAEMLKIQGELGSIAPGKVADILLVEDLSSFRISLVVANGEVVVRDGSFLPVLKAPRYPDFMYNTIKLRRRLEPRDFEVRAPAGRNEVTIRVIGAADGAILTQDRRATVRVQGGLLKQDVERDLLKIAMIDRYYLTGKVGKGFVQGFNLKRGAIASTYAPIAENIIVVGASDEDMCFASNMVAEMGGGYVLVHNGTVLAQLELPLCGLLSEEPAEAVLGKQKRFSEVIGNMGCRLTDPAQTLAFLGANPEIGTLKICEEGVMNVSESPRLESLVVE